jgi:hypothetical protein
MSRRLGIVAGTLTVLAGTWIALELNRPKAWVEGTFDVPIVEDIRSFEVTRNGETWRVEREGSDQWFVTTPTRFPANAAYVGAMTELFDAADRPVRDLVRSAQEAGSALGFAEGSGENSPIRVTVNGRERSLTLRIGANTTVAATGRTLTWVAPEGDTSIYRVGADMRAPFERTAADLRDRNMISLDEDAITAVTFDSPSGRMTLRRAGDIWSIEGGSEELDQELVARTVRALSALRAGAIADDQTIESAGLATPTHRVTVETPARSITVALGTRMPENEEFAPRAYAAVEGVDGVFIVSEAGANRISTNLGDLIDRTVLLVDRRAPSSLTIVEGTTTATFSATQPDCAGDGSDCDSNGLEWTADGVAVEGEALEQLVGTLVALEASRWALDVDPATAGLDSPRRTLRLGLRVGVEHTLEIGGELADDTEGSGVRAWARLDGGRIFELSQTVATTLLAPIDTLRGQPSTP